MMSSISMTAKICLFARWYHTTHSNTPVFADPMAQALLTAEEKAEIADAMSGGVSYFLPGFVGTKEEALDQIVNRQLAPSPLGRSAFAEQALENAVRIGAKQYLLLGAGYDTFAYRQPQWASGLQIFELDQPEVLQDKQIRLNRAAIPKPENLCVLPANLADKNWAQHLTNRTTFDRTKVTFCSLLGVCYYLSADALAQLVQTLFQLLPTGSSLVLDYPSRPFGTTNGSAQATRQAALAGASGETMQPGYTVHEMEMQMQSHGFLIYEHLIPAQITKRFFAAHNQAEPNHPIQAADQVCYALAVRQRN